MRGPDYVLSSELHESFVLCRKRMRFNLHPLFVDNMQLEMMLLAQRYGKQDNKEGKVVWQSLTDIVTQTVPF